jgi:hypothetical protein
MASKKASIAENVQHYLENLDWLSAIGEMEKLFAIDKDPLIRVRMGDAWRKLNKLSEAVQDYLYAADLFADRGFIGKALAQYNLVLKFDSSHKYALSKREMLRSSRAITSYKREPIEYLMSQPLGNASSSQEMFSATCDSIKQEAYNSRGKENSASAR